MQQDQVPRDILRLPVEPGTSLEVAFRHSVEGIIVRGEFVVEPANTLRAAKTSYPSYGAGLEKLRRGAQTRLTPTSMTWFPANRRYAELVFRITKAEDFRLTVAGREIALSALLPDSTRVRLRVRHRRRARRWFEALARRFIENGGQEVIQ